MKRTLVILVLLLALTGAGIALVEARKARNESARPAQAIPVTVTARTLRLAEVILTRPAVAEVRALTEAVVASRLSGYVLSMPFTEGQRVKKGEVLARLDATEAEAELARAEAELARSRQEEVTLAAELAAASTALDTEAQRYRRLEALYKTQSVSREQVQGGEAALAAARARKASAEAARNAYQDALRAAESVQRAARENLRYAVLTAPFDGLVAARLAQPGDLATPGKPLYKLMASDESRLLVSLPEQINPAGLRLAGRLLPIQPWPEATAQSMRRFEARARDLMPGTWQPVEIVLYHGQAVFVPDDCLLAGEARRATLLKPVAGKVHAVPVTLAASGVEGAASADAGLNGARVLCGSADALMRLAAGAPLRLEGEH